MTNLGNLSCKMTDKRGWYAIYTKSRSELKTADIIDKKGIEVFVPVKKTLRQWSDRKKMVTEPLIRPYIFVKVNSSEYTEAIKTNGAVRYLFYCGNAAVIPENQINTLKVVCGKEAELECVYDNIEAGTEIVVNAGSFKGLHGELVNYEGKHKVAIRLEQLGQAVLLKINKAFVEPVGVIG